jgi:hypothetical protein
MAGTVLLDDSGKKVRELLVPKKRLVEVKLNVWVDLPYSGDALLQNLVGTGLYWHVPSEARAADGVVHEPEFVLILTRPLRDVLELRENLCVHFLTAH